MACYWHPQDPLEKLDDLTGWLDRAAVLSCLDDPVYTMTPGSVLEHRTTGTAGRRMRSTNGSTSVLMLRLNVLVIV
jgi:hypothetical protein